MLETLRIRNFALIDSLELDLGDGLNVLTGETGAGKSIILDAIDIALGGKVSSRMIRTGNQRAMVEATFTADLGTAVWLKEQEIDLIDEDLVICSRDLAIAQTSLRSRSRVNGVLVNRKFMEQLRSRLVEITAQGQTVQLMIPTRQRNLLDLYGGAELLQQRETVAQVYALCSQAEQALGKRRSSEQERLQRLDLIQYQIQELSAANLSDSDELEQQLSDREMLSHVVELQKLSYQVYQLLYQNDTGEPAAADLLGEVESLLTEMAEYDLKIEPILEVVKTAVTQVVEAGQQINGYGDRLEVDPERLAEVEERVRILKQICRKYGPTLADAIAHYDKLQIELAELTDSGQSLEDLEQEYQKLSQKLTQECQELTKLRQIAAQKLEAQLISELKPLAMEKVQFQCQLKACEPTTLGADTVTYYFSPNPGEPLQPLSAIASGGEMSRFLLALKACFSQTDDYGVTLIFDEIDAGVSGKVAQAIAEKLHQLSQKQQVLCVTHQPLIAALADVHFRVDKQIIDQLPLNNTDKNSQQQTLEQTSELRTVVRVTNLQDLHRRREELAELAGGHSAHEARAFAESLLSQAAQRRQQK
ncbi:MAG: DNA repair protein RecN [Oscillatoria sp. PMC 1068.18]|nr:DNA repair protein RecN [Oscillatoria sp. PMC 1076.18]MEC4989425.1 DNA repair protein RecN [Oscillatoria sp. PMC 1068.18]